MFGIMLPHPPELASALSGRYTLKSVLGVGGTATVYRARDEKHGRDVAIKVMRPQLAASLTRQRFVRETEIVARLQHPHILSLIDSGSAADTYYFVMPLVDGETLQSRLTDGPPLSVGQATRILTDLADALSYAHARGVVHRDLKPSNVLLSGRHALLMDFGVAKGMLDDQAAPLTVGIALGTPRYMSPEQAMALPTVDHRADLYALGILGYELLAGQPPFVGGSPRDVLAAHVSQTPQDIADVRADVPDALREVVMRCLAKAPEDRWPDAQAIVDELDGLVTPSPDGTTPVGSSLGAAAPGWRRSWVVVPAAAVLVAGMIMVNRSGDPAAPTSLDREQITFEGNVIESAVSVDGSWLAYVTADGDQQTLLVRDLNAARALELDRATQVSGLQWSDDGSEIVYRTGPRSPILRAMPRLGGPGRVLGPGASVPSPDLSRLAIYGLGAPDILLIDPSAGDTIHMQRPSWVQWTYRLVWAPDSERIAVEVADPEATDFAILVTDAEMLFEAVRDSAKLSEPSFSANGRFLFYLRHPAGELPDLMRVALGPHGRPERDPEVVFSAFDGEWREDLIAAEYRNRLSHANTGDVFYVRTDGESNIWAFGVDNQAGGGQPEALTTGSAVHTNVRVSPDGERLALVRTTRIARVVGIMPADGGALQPMQASFVDGDVAWSPTGERLAMTWSPSQRNIRIAVHDFGTGATHPVETGDLGPPVEWAGDQLVTQGPLHRNLMLIDPASGHSRIVVEDAVGWNFQPRVSADLRRIAYFKRRPSQSGLWMKGLTGDEEARHLVAEEVNPLRFDESGAWIYAADNGLGNGPPRVLRVSVSTGESEAILTLPAGFVVQDITADGRRVFATRVEWRGDVWRLAPPAA